MMRRKMLECRPCRTVRQIGLTSQPQRLPQLIEIVVIAERQVLIEPFGGEQFGSSPFCFASRRRSNANAHESLRALGQRDDTEPERQAQFHRALVELNIQNLKRQ